MFDPIESDAIYGTLDETEEAVAAANELAEKHDDPDMQMFETAHVQLLDDCYNCFNDGETKIDYILVYEDKRTTTVDELMISFSATVNNDENEKLALALEKQKNRRRLFKRRFLNN
ncbi:unnamed protein product, partial [Rotaria sp. Silwood2]